MTIAPLHAHSVTTYDPDLHGVHLGRLIAGERERLAAKLAAFGTRTMITKITIRIL